MPLETGTVDVHGLEVAYLAEGPSDGPLAVCLHGFPDTAHTYRYLLPELAAAGYRAVAPFLRGYAPTGIPADGRYSSAALALDAIRLHEALGGGADAVLVGHDWGAIAAYPAAAAAPDHWRRVAAMAVPPPPALGGMLTSYDQLKRSFYMWFFQLPLAEYAVAANDLEFIARLWCDWSPGYDATEDVAHVRDALREPANLAAAIGYYRANFGGKEPPPDEAISALQAKIGNGMPSQPVLYLHGEDDGCLGVDLARAAEPILQGESAMAVVPGAGHFLHLERPADVNQRILEFLQA